MLLTLGGAVNAIHAINQKVDAAGSTAVRAGRLAEGAGSASMEAWNQAMQSAGQQPMEPSMRPAPMKPPAPARFKGVNKEPRILEWVHQAGQFLMSTGMTDSVQGVFHITNYLSDEAAVWWRRYCQRIDRGEVTAPLNCVDAADHYVGALHGDQPPQPPERRLRGHALDADGIAYGIDPGVHRKAPGAHLGATREDGGRPRAQVPKWPQATNPDLHETPSSQDIGRGHDDRRRHRGVPLQYQPTRW